jgi:hypothetical protein
LGPLGTAATIRPTVLTPGDYDGEFGGMMFGRENQSTQRKPAPVPLCPPQTPTSSDRTRTRTAVVGNQRLTAGPMARPGFQYKSCDMFPAKLLKAEMSKRMS